MLKYLLMEILMVSTVTKIISNLVVLSLLKVQVVLQDNKVVEQQL